MKTVQFFVIATCNKVLRDTLPQTPPPPELCTPQFSGFFLSYQMLLTFIYDYKYYLVHICTASAYQKFTVSIFKSLILIGIELQKSIRSAIHTIPSNNSVNNSTL